MSGSSDQPRAVPRYVANPPIQAGFGDQRVALLNLSVAGAMLLHQEPLTVGHEAALQMQLSTDESLALYGEILWTRAHRATGRYLSGVRFTEWIEVAQHAIDELVKSGVVRLDSSTPPQKLDRNT